MVIDAQATPAMAEKVIERVRGVTDKPIKYVALSHYHAVRVLGASAYDASDVIASDACRAMIAERGQEDWDSEYGRFPRLFKGADTIPGLTWPTLTFSHRMTVYLGRRRVDLIRLGRAHTAGDIVAYVPDAGVMFSGDIVEYKSACYCGDGHFGDWPATLDAIAAFGPRALVPGRGDALVGEDKVAEAIGLTRDFLTSTYRPVAEVALGGGTLKDRDGGLPGGVRTRSSRITPSTSTACRSTSPAPLMRRAASTRRASGHLSATAPCGRSFRAEGMGTYAYAPFAYAPPPELRGGPGRRRPVVVVGGGPRRAHRRDRPRPARRPRRRPRRERRRLGRLARHLLGQAHLGDLGPARPSLIASWRRAVTWRVGRVYHGARELYAFDLLPEAGHKMPAFVNLQQYYVEQYLGRARGRLSRPDRSPLEEPGRGS